MADAVSKQIRIVEVSAGAPVKLPEDASLLTAEYLRDGADLRLEGQNGVTIVKDYFAADSGLDLLIGGAVVPGRVVGKLTRSVETAEQRAEEAKAEAAEAAAEASSETAAQYVVTKSPAPEWRGDDIAIGRVSEINGDVFILRPDGARVVAEEGQLVFQDDVLETADTGSIGVTFIDGMTFSLSDSGRMVLDEFAFDASANEGGGLLSVLQGKFSFVSGDAAHTGDDALMIETPTMTIGVRGTKVVTQVDANGGASRVALLAEEDGTIGEIAVITDAGQQILNQPNHMVEVSGRDAPPSEQIELSSDEVVQYFESALEALPAPKAFYIPGSNHGAHDVHAATPEELRASADKLMAELPLDPEPDAEIVAEDGESAAEDAIAEEAAGEEGVVEETEAETAEGATTNSGEEFDRKLAKEGAGDEATAEGRRETPNGEEAVKDEENAKDGERRGPRAEGKKNKGEESDGEEAAEGEKADKLDRAADSTGDKRLADGSATPRPDADLQPRTKAEAQFGAQNDSSPPPSNNTPSIDAPSINAPRATAPNAANSRASRNADEDPLITAQREAANAADSGSSSAKTASSGAAPVFTSSASGSAAENVNDSAVVYTATATDADADATGGTITFSLTNDAGGLFEIDSATGEVTLAAGKSLDFETATSHAITIRSSDGVNTTDQNVTINVTDANDAPVIAKAAAVDFSTRDSAISFGDPGASNGNLDIATDAQLTVEAWFYHDGSSATNEMIVSKGNREHNVEGYSISMQGTDLVLRLDTGGLNIDAHTAATSIDIGATPGWRHVAMVIDADAGTISGFLNGSGAGWSSGYGDVQNNTFNDSPIGILNNRGVKTSDDFVIGAVDTGSGYGNFGTQMVSDVRVWNTARTETEIASNMSVELQGDETGLVLNAKLNEGSGATVTDSSPGGLVGDLISEIDWIDLTNITLARGDTETGRLSASDSNGDALTFAIKTNGAHGAASIDANTGIWSYTPSNSGASTDTVSYQVSDSSGNIDTITVTYNITG